MHHSAVEQIWHTSDSQRLGLSHFHSGSRVNLLSCSLLAWRLSWSIRETSKRGAASACPTYQIHARVYWYIPKTMAETVGKKRIIVIESIRSAVVVRTEGLMSRVQHLEERRGRSPPASHATAAGACAEIAQPNDSGANRVRCDGSQPQSRPGIRVKRTRTSRY